MGQRYAEFQALAKQHLGAEQRFKGHLLARWLEGLVRHPGILDVVEDIIGPDILCWSTDFFAKPPATSSYVSFHQDSTYAGLEPADGIVNAWLAFTPTTTQNGCLRIVPGSQQWGQLAHDNTYAEDNMLFFGQQVRIDLNSQTVCDIQLKPGEISLHHMQVVHGSGPNKSQQPRIGMVIRYMRPDARQLGARDSAMLVRGTDHYGHFDLETGPQQDFDDAAIARFKNAIVRPSGLGDTPR